MTQQQLAIVFPGQGSQSIGMLKEIAERYPTILQTFDDASAILGYDLWALTQHGPSERLDQTIQTQPVLLTAGYALWKLLQTMLPLQPAYLAGHSLGEYTALVCAQALQFSDALKLVQARGQFMQTAVPEGTGAMAAIVGLEEEVVQTLCEELATAANGVLSPANFNSVGQIVVAGHKALVAQAILQAKTRGAKLAMLIPVSVPSHCALMTTAAEQLAALIAQTPFTQPQIPVVNNVNASVYADAEDIRQGLIAQLSQPVQWVKTIQYLSQHNVTTIIECGPGKVLTGLNKRINKNLKLNTTCDIASLDILLAETQHVS